MFAFSGFISSPPLYTETINSIDNLTSTYLVTNVNLGLENLKKESNNFVIGDPV